MDLRQLRYFIAIVEQGSFSRAAHHLHIAQPALSQHVRHMEADLGVELLFRGPRGVTPTEAGETLLHHARLIVRQFEFAREVLKSDGAEPGGQVRFGLPGTVSQILSVPLIEEARARYPQIRLRVAEAMSGFILDWLRDGKVDLGIIYRAVNSRGLVMRHILSEELCLLGPPGTMAGTTDPETGEAVIDLEEAAALGLILPGPGHGLRDQLDEVALRHRVRLNVDIELDAYAQIKMLTRRGLGFAILPRMAIKQEAGRGQLAAWRIRNPAIERNVYIASSNERPLTTAARAVQELCRTLLCRLVREDVWTAVLSPEAEDG